MRAVGRAGLRLIMPSLEASALLTWPASSKHNSAKQQK
jgi:hypothetical protein